jgi:RNA polymerase primary sigma factor
MQIKLKDEVNDRMLLITKDGLNFQDSEFQMTNNAHSDKSECESDAMKLYVKEMTRYPLLSPEEEIKIFKRIERNRAKVAEIALRYPVILHAVCSDKTKQQFKRLFNDISSLELLPQKEADFGNAEKEVKIIRKLHAIYNKLDLTNRKTEIIIDTIKRYGEAISFVEQVTGKNQKLSDPSPDDLEKLKGVRRNISEKIDVPCSRCENMEDSIVTTLSKIMGVETIGQETSIRIKGELSELIEAHTNIKKAECEILKRNLRLVNSIARKYANLGLPLTDLVQEGNIGLLTAIKKFDYHRGNKFSTYAIWWVRQAIFRAIQHQGLTIRVPVHMHNRLSKVKRIYRKLATETGRKPTSEEIAQATNLTMEQVERALEVARKRNIPSLDNPIGDSDDFSLGHLISDSADSPEENSVQRETVERVRDILLFLTPREQEIIRKRFGMDDDMDHTLQQLAEQFSVSRERIRQIQNEALDKLRRAMENRGLNHI